MPIKKYRLTIGSILTILLLIFLQGCSELGYYLQCAKGQFELMQRAKPIASLLESNDLPPTVRNRLELVQTIRNFASTELKLPDNESYRSYADLERPYVVWNVVATKEFSLQPQQWCFPVAGCVSYRGYFNQTDAESLAATLREENKDVDVYGVQAYSTLNWFSDPVLNTFLNSPETRLAGLIFHELAHQLIYVQGDSSFNEAFAQTVQLEGVKRWLQHQHDPQTWISYQHSLKQQQIFHQLLQSARNQLDTLYSQPDLSESDRRVMKQQILTRTQERFSQLKDAGNLDTRFDRWMAKGLNNARLASLATYYELLPGFQNLLDKNSNLPAFYDQVRVLSKQTKEQRQLALLLK